MAIRSDDEKVWLQEPFRLEDHVEHVTADRVEPVRHAVRACDLGRLLECVVVLDGEVLRGELAGGAEAMHPRVAPARHGEEGDLGSFGLGHLHSASNGERCRRRAVGGDE